MPRIPEEKIQYLKLQTDIVSLIRSYGVELKQTGNDYIGCCKFHDDKTPSLVVTPNKGLWHCMGACDTGGSVIDWVMQADSLTFRDAVQKLDKQALPASLAAKKEKAIVSGTTDILIAHQTLIEEVLTHYHQSLLLSETAQDYMHSRKIYSQVAIEQFNLGYSDRSYSHTLAPRQNKQGSAKRAALQAVGLLRNSGHELFRGSLVVPITNKAGQVVNVYGRKTGIKLRPGTQLHSYLPGPQAGVFNYAGLVGQPEIILCESIIDALTFYAAGVTNVTCSFGVNGFTDEILQAFKELQVQHCWCAYDADEAGHKGSQKLQSVLSSQGIHLQRMLLPEGMDVNEVACACDDPKDVLLDLIEQTKKQQQSQPTDQEPENQSGDAATREYSIADNGDLLIERGVCRYRVRGLERNTGCDTLRVNVHVSKGELFFVDVLDLYVARQRTAFIKSVSTELAVDESILKKDLGYVLRLLESIQQERNSTEEETSTEPELTEAQKSAAMQLLSSPDLVQRILADFEKAGLVGEQSNKLVGYLAAVSRQLDQPMAVIVQSSSAAGKTSLMDAILAFMPDEKVIKYSAMTGQSLFYMSDTNLCHKILAVVEEEGAQRASYSLKLLQSEGELSISSTGKDPQSGRLVAQEYRVQGPVMIFLTTTAIDIDEELLNRCLVLTVNESQAQTEAIHIAQRKAQTIEGLVAAKQKKIIYEVHRNAQRLLRGIEVVNPFVNELQFNSQRTRSRRDHMKYLSLIKSITLLHQYQRPLKSYEDGELNLEYIEVERSDIDLANHLLGDLLAQGVDELPPQTRRLYRVIEAFAATHVSEEEACFSFSRKELRVYSGLGDTQLKIHLARLVDLEYLQVYRGDYGAFVYEFVPDQSGLYLDRSGSNGDQPGVVGAAPTSEELHEQGHSPQSGGLSASIVKGQKSEKESYVVVT